MDGIVDGIVAKDPRVLAMLTAPEDYFDEARRKARREARVDIATDLVRRARRRHKRSSDGSEVLRQWPS